MSAKLAKHYEYSTPPFKDELWESLISLADARSSTEKITPDLSKEEIATLTAEGKYIENKDVDLSDEKVWKSVIFKNCAIHISKLEKELKLEKVQFIESSFQLNKEDPRNKNLLLAVLGNTGSQITGRIIHYRVFITVNNPKLSMMRIRS